MDIHGGWLTVNRFCNMRCRWCYATGTAFRPEDNMPLNMAKSLVDLMYDLGVGNVVLIGGETLFWKHLFEVATYIKSRGMESTVVTNGWLLGQERFRERVRSSDITAINISLKGGNRQQYIDLTGFDGFEKTLEGLREVAGWGKPEVSVSTVISRETLNNLHEIAAIAFENGTPAMSFSICNPAFSNGTMDTQHLLHPQEVVNAFMAQYEAINRVSGGHFALEGSVPACLWSQDFLRTMEEKRQVAYGCHFKNRSGVIFDRWGKVIPCNILYEYPIGQYGVDFTDVESFQNMWERPQLTAFYNKMLSYPATACVKCDEFVKCGGGCPLNWFVRKPEDTIPTGGITWTS